MEVQQLYRSIMLLFEGRYGANMRHRAVQAKMILEK